MQTLEIRSISKSYSSETKALDSVSLHIPQGMFGLLGPNGAGKSSLMRTIATLQKPDEGQILFGDIDIHQNPQALRSQLGYLPQEFGVYPRMSAFELLDHMALLKGILSRKQRREQALALLEQTNLYAVRNKAVGTFSGGMKQRFGIAQALLGSPRLIIVDEPTAGLDPQERNRFLNLLSEIGENVVLLLSTHIVEDVRELCPRMAILAGGKIVLQGEPASLIQTLKGRVWHKTIARDQLPHYQKTLSVLSVRLLAGKTQIQVLSDDQPEAGFTLLEPDLEDVYFSVLFGTQSTGKEISVC
ncbi:ABC transporter ATP-binding protein [Cytophagaceae bacterium YF14B1]|uniref:ABC transporter ATP-binding protein n=1 Tax=Xanthocytophaga flava TaxID=3048013 RepID=A0AAE3QUU4_9BACT|nr:ABC transporter ATP-binding protein [Xanthocytophaga flavus]MDJ1485827.1 ABC transporter ATP-binding protein [Xanthocytophaga flavus]